MPSREDGKIVRDVVNGVMVLVGKDNESVRLWDGNAIDTGYYAGRPFNANSVISVCNVEDPVFYEFTESGNIVQWDIAINGTELAPTDVPVPPMTLGSGIYRDNLVCVRNIEGTLILWYIRSGNYEPIYELTGSDRVHSVKIGHNSIQVYVRSEDSFLCHIYPYGTKVLIEDMAVQVYGNGIVYRDNTLLIPYHGRQFMRELEVEVLSYSNVHDYVIASGTTYSLPPDPYLLGIPYVDITELPAELDLGDIRSVYVGENGVVMIVNQEKVYWIRGTLINEEPLPQIEGRYRIINSDALIAEYDGYNVTYSVGDREPVTPIPEDRSVSMDRSHLWSVGSEGSEGSSDIDINKNTIHSPGHLAYYTIDGIDYCFSIDDRNLPPVNIGLLDDPDMWVIHTDSDSTHILVLLGSDSYVILEYGTRGWLSTLPFVLLGTLIPTNIGNTFLLYNRGHGSMVTIGYNLEFVPWMKSATKVH